MLLIGSLNVVTSIEMAINASYSSKVLFIGELNNNIPNTFIPCSILLPPYNAINAEINGDIQSYTNEYTCHLGLDRNCFEMFATILVALHQGINITLFIENSELMHYQFLLNYLQNTYGITAGTEQSMYMYNKAFDASNATILLSYMDGYISVEEYLDYINNDLNCIFQMEGIPYILDIPELIICDYYGIPKENVDNRRRVIAEVLYKRAYMHTKGPLVVFEKDKKGLR
ncbi:hypothetical protein [uncultured Clostridium sp.]|uniref:hypothetical protein n=1 Tax=uncultured Clostridium sp. TaxID=59620 RepID=UPI00263AE2EB|nr:hypothetical protein [uncultured Clostridium sp.]